MSSETFIAKQTTASTNNIEMEEQTIQKRFLPERALQKHLDLLRQLQASLVRSHRAFVALDLSAIKQETQEQLCLSQSLQQELHYKFVETHQAGDALELCQELAQSEHEVMQSLRLQSALLERGQRKLQILRNTLAGPAINYSSIIESSARLSTLSGKRETWI